MRFFEVLLLFLLPCLGSLPLLADHITRQVWFRRATLAMTAVIGIHLATEGWRWQMMPAYFLAIVVAIVLFFGLRFDWNRIRMVLWFSVCAVLMTIAVGLPVLIPVFSLPAPSGPYAVGRTEIIVVDTARGETFTPDPDDLRRLAVLIWYPATTGSSNGRRAAYLPNDSFWFGYWNLIRTHSRPDAPLAKDKTSWPVLIFNHGGGCWPVQNTIQIEELASRGYVVCSIAHPYDSAVTPLPDTPSMSEIWAVQKPVLNDNNRAFEKLRTLIDEHSGLEEIKTAMRRVYDEHRIARDVIERRTRDTRTVIDQLALLNGDEGNLFHGKLDLDRLGLFGMSNGAAVAVNTAMQDARVKAVLNMDGYLFGDVFDQPLSIPFMWMSKFRESQPAELVYEQAAAPAYAIFVKGTTHFNFVTEAYLWVTLFHDRFLGEIDPRRINRLINDYSLAFFDKYLNGEDQPLLEGPATRYPEVLFNGRNLTARTEQ